MSVITSENDNDEDEVQFEEDRLELYDLEENIVE
jgi:hypothetical protein